MNILVVEDEARVADFIRRGLRAEGWAVEHTLDGEAALAILGERSFDAVVLDVMLPGITGSEVCRIMRARKIFTPVLMLTALDAVEERVAGLGAGADDYLAKPFAFDELIARLQALVRRATRFGDASGEPRLACGPIAFDRAALKVTVEGEPVNLTAREREILTLFLNNPGRVLSRERLLNAAWGHTADPLTNVIDVYVGRLRRKLGPAGRMIETVRGAGYRLSLPERE